MIVVWGRRLDKVQSFPFVIATRKFFFLLSLGRPRCSSIAVFFRRLFGVQLIPGLHLCSRGLAALLAESFHVDDQNRSSV